MRQETRPATLLARPAPAALFLLVVLVLAASAARGLVRAHADRMRLVTGRAEWIWYAAPVAAPRPIRFFATQQFVLPEAPRGALAKVFVDREHALWVNGRRVGGGTQRPGDPLAIYEIAPLLRAGENRIAIEAASPDGIGGILAAVDVRGLGRNALVTDGRWRVSLDPASIRAGAAGAYRPVVWGGPPQYPWGYPRMPRPAELLEPVMDSAASR